MKNILLMLTIIFISLALIGCKNNDDNATKIQVYTRDTSSGTRDAFFSSIDFPEAVKDDSVLANKTLIVDSNGDMITKIKNDKNGIGYISLSSYNDLVIKGLSVNNVIASDESVLNGSYPLKRGFYYIVTNNLKTDADRLAQAFNAYLTTIDALVMIKAKGGIIDLNQSNIKWDDIKLDYPITLQDNSKTILRFGGSTSVETIAKGLALDFSIKSGNVKIEHNFTGSSAAYKSTQGEDSNSNDLLHVGFSSRMFNNNEVAAENTSGLLSYDAIVTIVNKSNLLNDISPPLLKKIYKGETIFFGDDQL